MKHPISLAAVLIVVLAIPASTVRGQPIALPVQGEPFAGKLVAANAAGQLIFSAAGKPRTVSGSDLIAWGSPAELHEGPIIVLADGGRFPALIQGATQNELTVLARRGGQRKLPLNSLAGIIYRPPSNPQEFDALLDRLARGDSSPDRKLASADQVILDNGDAVSGVIEAVEAGKLTVKSDLGSTELPIQRVVAAIFNPALRQLPAGRAGAAWVGLADGTRLRAAAFAMQDKTLTITDTWGAKWNAAAADLVFFMPQSGRAVFLSDIRDPEYVCLPYLEMKWHYQSDRNVTGGQLRCGGKLYVKGLGMHSASRLSYRIDPRWSRFQAQIGIDDSTAGRGSAGFRVFVDGKLKFSAPTVRGGVAPRAVSVDLTGATKLDLVVDFGEAGDVLDHADWLNARLVR